MGKRLEGNGIYESSRMIMPEHREAMLQQEKEQQRKGKPILDEQAIEEIVRTLAESYHEKTTVDLVVFSPFDDEHYSGVVIGINQSRGKVNLLLEDGEKEITIAEIISANL
ncbi:YolD-like family protein [Paenibacillus barcinonensis]|uniref:YolD-like family protein n=1 Tax=Paenibacillus barcinonensis TaxID=198119 RepID=A0A2V4VFD6_PAEBA|nr:YolD-like family protein [Paenibacillus barcinonensis]PYE52476.1 YolD-like protein [Paenibacillus barcinonensis]QKS59361.1 YolD-like family protein [Paenibacillus barcinonensis]QKS59419.1 YolD-like family protein [Paenibacillus barcinonensis]